jgi:hypothetical protein
MDVQFKEVQKFSGLIWLLLAPLGIFIFYGIVKQFVFGVPFGDNPMSNIGLILVALLVVAIVLLFLFLRLETKINKEFIQIRFFPFTSKTIQWEDIKSAEVLQYGFVGGWGLRIGTKYGTVYNMSGDKGLALELNSGKKILIGSQRLDELKKVISQIEIPLGNL